MTAAGGTAAAGVGGSFSFNFILNLIMSTSMNQMLSSIKNMQVIVHLILFSFVVPGVTAIFFGALADMITFDPFDGASEYTSEYFALDMQEEETLIDDMLADLGYESNYFLTNLGTLLYFLVAWLSLIPVYFLVAICPLCYLKCRKWSRKKLRSFFFNSILTCLDGTFFLFFITGMINIKQAHDGNVPKN